MADSEDFKSLDKSVRKQRIIEVAAELFCKNGYQSTSLGDVAGRLGISKAGIYHYVASKDDLLSIIYTQAFAQIFDTTRKIWQTELPPDKKLRMILRNHIKNIIVKDLSMFSVFFSEESQLPEKDFQKIREEKKRYTGIIVEIIKEGIAGGCFRPLDPELLAYAILGMCNWIYKWYRPEHTPYRPEDIADHFIDLLEGGYLSAQPSPENCAGARPGPAAGGERAEKGEQVRRQIRQHYEALGKLLFEAEKPESS